MGNFLGGKAESLDADQAMQVASVLERGPCGERNRCLWLLGLATACRMGELLSLEVRDVWVETSSLRSPLSHVILGACRTKTRTSRTVELDPMARIALTRYMLTRGPVNPLWPLFPSSDHPMRALSYRQAEKYIVAAGRALGLGHVSSHSMRRSAANICRKLGYDLNMIREMLGHKTLAMTQEYLGISPAEMTAMYARKGAELALAQSQLTNLPLSK